PTVGGLRTPPPEKIAPSEDWEGVKKVAVIPPANWTTDIRLQYTNWFRAVIAAYLSPKGWTFVSQAVVNRSMSGWKFTMAGELVLFTAQELCEKWECDAIFIWDIKEASYGRTVLSFSFLKADGTMLWATGERSFVPLYNIIDPSNIPSKLRIIGMGIGDSLRDFPVCK
ncbi:MAG: hypothetical protein QF645_05445, partial [Planctomycetota bacterium]|nr:hypothetical protein [Planctomycetota bacterium]